MKRRSLLGLVPGAAALAALEARADVGPLRPAADVPKPDVPAPANLAWWREARFGMFVHWGPVSLRGTEIGWSRGDAVPVEEYDALYRRFDPQAFDAADVGPARARGGDALRRPHDEAPRRLLPVGPSRLTDYHVGKTPFRRDVGASSPTRAGRRASSSARTTRSSTGATPTTRPAAGREDEEARAPTWTATWPTCTASWRSC